MKDIESPLQELSRVTKPYRSLVGVLALLAINVLYFGYTNPFSSSSLVVFVGFILVSFDIWCVTKVLVAFLGILLPHFKRIRRRLTVALVSFFVVILALTSVGQLTARDIVVVAIIWVLGYMYSLRVLASKR